MKKVGESITRRKVITRKTNAKNERKKHFLKGSMKKVGKN